jgi:hypothetical protein
MLVNSINENGSAAETTTAKHRDCSYPAIVRAACQIVTIVINADVIHRQAMLITKNTVNKIQNVGHSQQVKPG